MSRFTRGALILALSLAVVLSACGDDEDTSTDDTTTDDTTADTSTDEATTDDTTTEDTTSEDAVSADQAGGLVITAIDFSTAEVQLTNTSDAEIDIDGWVMCNFPTYAPISGVDPIGPGQTITVTSTVAIPAEDGELGIYTAEDFTNPEAIVAYVEWGSDGHTRAEVAVAAGIWDGTALAPDGDVLTVGG